MATKRKLPKKPSLVTNPLVRILGQHRPAHEVVQLAAQKSLWPITMRTTVAPPTVDYTLIDPGLTIDSTSPDPASTLPPTGVGYAAFTPSQRHALLQWLNQPEKPAALAFQHLYLAHLEVGLFETERLAAVEKEIERLLLASAWRHHLGLARLRLLADWLAQNGPRLTGWLGSNEIPGSLLGVALGLQALLQQPLQPQQLSMLFRAWSMSATPSSNALLALRLSSLTNSLGGDPLAYALAQLPESAHQAQPWRTHHRDLRIALPQPDLRSTLEPLLRDLTATDKKNEDMIQPEDADDTPIGPTTTGWRLVLEFSESRSDFFDIALDAAREQPGYLAILDEDRRMVHRVHFRKGEVRRFWRLWEYVQSWSNTKVYLNGDEVSKWELYGRLWQVR
jgi:hypothetical protein